MEELERIFEELRRVVEDVSYPTVRRWKQENPEGRVLGHFQVYFPEEIAHAAGMLPVKVAGAGSYLSVRQADARIAAFVCSVVRSSLELALSGHLNFLSVLIIPNICDAARHSCGVWARNFPHLRVETLYYPQNAASPHALDYLVGEYRRLGRILEEETGRRIREDDLRASIALFNENRRLLREIYRIKRETPWLLSAVEAYLLVRSAGLMPREEHNALLRRVLAQLPHRQVKPHDRLRVIFVGGFCEQPPLDMLAVIQNACYIVDDDLLIGLRWVTEDVPLDGDPWRQLARAYLNASSYSPVRRDPRRPAPEMLIRQIREAKAEAALVAAAKMCEPGLDEQTAYVQALEEAGIPHLVLEFEEGMTVFEQLGMEVETFAESLLFFTS